MTITRAWWLHGSLLVAASFVGCRGASSPSAAPRAVDQDLGSVPSSAARVCVVRPATVASDVTMEIRDNGHLVGATRGSTFVCWLAAPGEHQIVSIDDDTGPTLLHARPGARYWLHQEVTFLGTSLHAHLDWIDDAAASDLLESCPVRVKASVPGWERRTDAVAVAPAKARR